MEIYNCDFKVTIILRNVALVMIRGVFGDSQMISTFWRSNYWKSLHGIWLKIITKLKHAKSLLLCLTLCEPMGCSLPASSVHGILQAIILEWVAISFSRESSWHRDWTLVSYIEGGFLTTEPPRRPLKIIREMQIKAMVKYHLTPIRMAIIKISANNLYSREYGEKWIFLNCWWECKLI